MNIGDLIDEKYLIKKEIGKGGMGKVFLVSMDDIDYALKVCLEDDEEDIKRFKREVRLMSNIKHANVIEILDSNLDYEFPYFVMPLCKYSLDEIVPKLKDDPKVALKLIQDVCKGVNAIHLSKIIHRDIKPKNILISQDDVIKVSDLGLGKFVIRDSSVITSSNVYMGTEGYIPTEFYRVGGTKNADVRSDIFQMGKTIYNVLTNTNPSLIENDILPGGLLYIIRKCTNANPDNRYQTVSALETAINNYLLSLEPKSNPKNYFSDLINIAKENLRLGSYQKDNVSEIVSSIYNFKNVPEEFFNRFHEIPLRIIEIISSNFEHEAQDLIQLFEENTVRHFKEDTIEFSDADIVADIAKSFFKGSKNLEIRLIAIKVTLFAATYCNRFYAMDIFDNMIQSIKDNESATVISDMLRGEIDMYEIISDRIPSNKLHPFISVVQQEIIEKQKAKIEAEKEELKQWLNENGL
ncbi:MAG: serine/threonine-protein kinase [Chryseobacterium taeanense]